MASCYMACASGVTSAPLNPAYRADEFEFYLSDLNAKALIVERDSTSPAIAVAASWACASSIWWPTATRRPGCSRSLPRDGAAALRRAPGGPAQADDVSMVLHTSGTTSRPKIVPLSQAQPGASASTSRARCSSRPATAG
jgi:oxalate---CoA ligase